jgi:hypothetical protein
VIIAFGRFGRDTQPIECLGGMSGIENDSFDLGSTEIDSPEWERIGGV